MSGPKVSSRWVFLVDALPLLVAGAVLWLLGQCWWGRVGHPFDLEWMEGGMLAHGWRLHRGLPLYSDPTADWVPYVYPPGYSALLALAGDGLYYRWGRGLSVAGSVAAAAAIVSVVHRHGRSLTLGVLAAAVFLFSYRASGAFMDLVRPDAVAMALAGWAVALTVDGRRGTDVAGGLLLCAAFLVKHNLAAFGVPLALGLWAWHGWRRALRFGLSSAVPALLLTVYLQWRSAGGFLTYLLEVPSSHPMMWDRGLPGSQGETGHWLGLVLFVAGVGLAVSAPVRGSSVRPEAVWGSGALLGGLAGAWALTLPPVSGAMTPVAPVLAATFFSIGASLGAGLAAGLAAAMERRIEGRWWVGAGLFWVGIVLATLMRAHNGGFINVLIPWHWVICALAGVLLGRARVVARSPLAQWGTAGLGAAVFGAQLGWLHHLTDLDPIVPTAQDVEAGERMLTRLEETCDDGPIFSPFAAWLPVQVGEAPSVHLIAIWDIDHRRGPLHDFMPVFSSATRQHHFACVVDGGKRPLGYGIPKAYVEAVQVRTPGRALMPKTGWRIQPQKILVPKEGL